MNEQSSKNRFSKYQDMMKELSRVHQYVDRELFIIWHDVPSRRRIKWSKALKSINEVRSYLETLRDENIDASRSVT